MNHSEATIALVNLLLILFILALSIIGLKVLLVALRKGVRLLASIIASLVPRRDLKQHGRVRATDQHWHRWFAWRPVHVQPYDSNGGWVGPHWVWLKRVERRVERWGWETRAYRKICR
jgi:hypothetical protein